MTLVPLSSHAFLKNSPCYHVHSPVADEVDVTRVDEDSDAVFEHGGNNLREEWHIHTYIHTYIHTGRKQYWLYEPAGSFSSSRWRIARSRRCCKTSTAALSDSHEEPLWWTIDSIIRISIVIVVVGCLCWVVDILVLVYVVVAQLVQGCVYVCMYGCAYYSMHVFVMRIPADSETSRCW